MSAKINSRLTLHEGRVFQLTRENITLENGTTIDLDIIRHPGASAVVPLSKKDTVLMLEQYRHAVGGFIWEIPAGTLSSGETPLDCAKRELIEETGFSARAWEKLGEITPLPGYSDERIHIFLATELTAARQNLDMDEVLRVHEMKLETALDMIHNGAIQDSKTISGLIMASHRLTR
jgi:ADP-ribose pyrophosphatase